MSFFIDEEKAESRPSTFKDHSNTGAPQGENDVADWPEGTTNWSTTSGHPPARYNRKQDSQHPASPLDTGTTRDTGTSSKVIPEGKDFENKEDRTYRKSAIRMNQIRKFVSVAVQEKAKKYTPVLTKVDKSRSLWLFTVGKWKVRVKAKFPPKGTKFDKATLHLTCSCPFWRWQGPEHWGKEEDYLADKPRGTASFPVIRDPEHEKAVCKHVYAVFSLLETYRYVPSLKKMASSGRVRVSYEGMCRMAHAIVDRYLGV